MTLKLYNYLTRKVESFKPLNPPNATLYTCGPTVYDFVHIGNWRTFIFEDILRRTLELEGFKVKHVMNITDIDDKIIKGSQDAGLEFKEFIKPFEKQFFEDLEKLNIKKAHLYPKATENIPQMINLIEKLIKKGFAYKTFDGVYFDISSFPNYGKLSNLEKRKIKIGARISADLYEKDDASDFALWKFPPLRASFAEAAAKTEQGSAGQALLVDPSWDAPFGEGRPGWHIECSAMSMKFLGESLDIHCGAVDLLFPHHENEIAQSEAVTDAKFVNFWLEGEHLLLSEQKMAKSLGNIVTLKDVEKKGLPAGRQGYDPLAFRYLVLTAHYRSKLNFTWESLQAAQNALNNLRVEVANWEKPKIGCTEFEENFRKTIFEDLNTPKALEIMWNVVKSDFPTSAKHKSVLLFDQVLGLGLDIVKPAKFPKGAKKLIAKRENLRQKGEFGEADKIRSQLQSMGVEIEDTPAGPHWKIKYPN